MLCILSHRFRMKRSDVHMLDQILRPSKYWSPSSAAGGAAGPSAAAAGAAGHPADGAPSSSIGDAPGKLGPCSCGGLLAQCNDLSIKLLTWQEIEAVPFLSHQLLTMSFAEDKPGAPKGEVSMHAATGERMQTAPAKRPAPPASVDPQPAGATGAGQAPASPDDAEIINKSVHSLHASQDLLPMLARPLSLLIGFSASRDIADWRLCRLQFVQ